jgi:ATP-dependent DNA helicase RecQ
MTASLQAPTIPGHDIAGDEIGGPPGPDAAIGTNNGIGTDDAMEHLADAARRVLGPGATLRDVQVDALRELDTHDTLLVARSGAGKTAVYAIATLLARRLTLVVSPLLALQRDQVDALRAAGLRAATVSTAVPVARRRATLEAAARGELDVVLLAPEQLAKTEVVEALSDADVGLLVIDEAHCLSEWGHDFRPDYLAVRAAARALGGPRVLALTATASPRVRDEIVAALALREPRVLVRDADRPNIWLGVRHRATAPDRDDEVLRTVLDEPGPTLVYARTRRHAEDVADALTAAGRAAEAYHGGLPSRRRAELQDAFLSGRADLMVATSAFGMGVDRADVRLVVHAGLPPSLDSYYQEVGRAGRDGEPARAVAITAPGELGLNTFLTSNAGPRPGTVSAVLEAVRSGATSRDAVVEASSLTARSVSRTLAALVDAGALTSTERGYTANGMTAREARQALWERARQRQALDRSRIEMVQAYAASTDCRRRLLLELLGESHPMRCGGCDSCDDGTSIDVVDARLVSGQHVVHSSWGAGTVTAIEPDRVTVLFDERGYVTLDTAVALDSGLLSTR